MWLLPELAQQARTRIVEPSPRRPRRTDILENAGGDWRYLRANSGGVIRFGINLPPFGEFGDARALAELARDRRAPRRGCSRAARRRRRPRRPTTPRWADAAPVPPRARPGPFLNRPPRSA